MNSEHPQIIRDLLDIHLLLGNMDSFFSIYDHISRLEAGTPGKDYAELKRITRTLRNVLNAFAEPTEKISRKGSEI